MCTRRLRLATALSACSEMPADAASEMMATTLRPAWKSLRSRMFTWSTGVPRSARGFRPKRTPGGKDGT